MWKYTPSAGSWRNVSPSQGSYGFSGLAVDPGAPATVMVTTLDLWWPEVELYRSTDGGTTWKALAANSERDDSGSPYVGDGIGHWMTALSRAVRHRQRHLAQQGRHGRRQRGYEPLGRGGQGA